MDSQKLSGERLFYKSNSISRPIYNATISGSVYVTRLQIYCIKIQKNKF